MTIGETLARARRDAGLSIAEISIRTRIRQSVIDGIEHDDYAACDGDSGARRAIEAVAQALGVDSEPLIQAYAAARRPAAGWIAATEPTEPSEPSEPVESVMAEPAPEVFLPEHDPWPVIAADDTQPISIGQPSGRAVAGEPPFPIPIGEPTQPVVASFSGRPNVIWIALGAALLAVAVLGGILLIMGASGQPPRHAVAAGEHRSGGRGARRTRPTGHYSGSSGHTGAAVPSGRRHVRPLVPVGIAAFGPGGAGHGDSPELARQALAGKAAAPWHSAWYTTPHFGNLQSGTGLLLKMGRPVTITSARIALGNGRGADVGLRIGNAPILTSMRPVAQADGAGGLVRLKTAPARGRYVLVWFTRLPPDPAGTFQVSVYDIKLRGYL